MSDGRDRRGLELSARARALLEQRLAAEDLGGAGTRERITRRPRPDEPAPLSSGQERVLFHERLLPGTATWHVPVALRTSGPLDAGALAAALGELASRHEVLRTRFLVRDGVPHQAVERSGALALPLDDLSTLPADERLATALARAARELRRPFDLASAPLARAALWRLDEEDHVFLLVLHHALCDAASLAVLLPELAELYAARVEARTPALAEPALHQADHAAWERARSETALADERAYWTERLTGAPRPTALDTDRPRSEARSGAGAWLARPLAAGLGGRLEQAARAHGTTPYVVLSSAFAALLARLCGEEDVLFGAPVGLRTRTELERVPGFLVNTVALRAAVGDDTSFAALVAAQRESVLGALANRELPFDEVVALTGSGAGPAPMRVLFDHRSALLRSLAFGPACHARVLDETLVHTRTAKTDLLLVTESVDGELSAAVEYDTALFEAQSMRSLLARFEVLLSAALEEPACPVGALPLATEDDAAEALALRGTSWPLEHASVLAAFRAQVARAPDAIALELGELQVSYAELAERAERLAARLFALGVGRGQRVALLAERTPALIVAHLAILRVGAAYVPLDPTHPLERWRFTLADSRASLVLVDGAHRTALPQGPRALVLADEGETELDPAPEPATRADDPAYVMYTSGSTGRPKGVLVAQRGILRLVLDARWARLGPGTALLQLAPIAFDAATFEIWGALLRGGKLVLHPERVPTPDELERVVRASRVTTLWLTAALFDALVDEAPRALAGLRQILTGGEALSVRHLRKAYAELPDVELINGYGPTECTTFAACHAVPRALPEGATSVPIGRPIRNTRAYVLDLRLRPVPFGVPGELYLGGDGLALGYVERPRETAARFVPDPFAEPPGARLYRTGDRALLRADGTLEFLGRVDEQIKLRGFRIEPGEVEAALAEQPGVERALVRAVTDEAGARTLVAWYVARAPAPEPEELASALRARLPAPLVPAALVRVDAFPRNANGKLDLRALPAPRASERTAVPGDGPAAAPGEPLRSEAERALGELWEGVLGAPPRGRDDDFFAAGGHSLNAAILLARAQQRFGVELRLVAFFEAPTLAGLARLLARAKSEAAPGTRDRVPLVRDDAAGDAPLAPNQRGLWYLWRLAPEDASYHVAVAVALAGPLDVAALEASVRGLVARHEALRTVYPVADGEPRTHVQPAPALRLVVDDLRALPAEERDAEAARLADTEARAPFDLERGPVFRARLVRTGEREASLFLVAHHLALDGQSLDLLARELRERYAATVAGAADPPGRAPALRHRDWARWQVAMLAAGGHERGLSYWKEALAGATWRLALPADRPRSANAGRRGATERLALAQDAAQAVRALASGANGTLFMASLAALQVLLARWTRQTDFLIGAPVSGRGRPELEDVVGFFVNVLPLRARLADDPSFASLLRRVRAAVLAGHAHQDVPFESLVQALKPERDRSGAPLPQVLLSVRAAGEPSRAAGVVFGAPTEVPTGTAKADLAFMLEETAEGLVLVLTYDAALFERTTATRLLRQLAHVLAGAAARPEERVSALPLADASELARLDARGRGSAPALPREGSVAALVSARAAERPDAPAVVCGDTTLSYSALERRADDLARRLRARGVARGELVGLCVERSAELPVLALAILKADAAYLPLDPAWPEERLRLLLRDAGVRTVLAAGRAGAAVPPDAARVLRTDATDDGPAASLAPLPRPSAGPDDPAYAIYTSGSTGQPKGVLVPHRGILRLVTGAEYARLGPDTRILALSPLAFDASTFDLWGALCNGGTCVVFPDPVPTPAALARAIQRGKVTTLFVTTALFDALVDEAPQALAGLRELCFGGERVSVRHVERCLAALPALELVHVYGPTESTTFATFHRVSRVAGRYGSSVPIGLPLANTRTLVLDAHMRPVATGIPGELWIGGDGLALGYLGDEELTRARFVPGAFAGGGRLYRTGDVVRWSDDGELEFLGRDDDQAKIRGHRIEPGEVQAVLERHPGLARVHVGVHADARGEKRLVAWAVPAAGRAVTERELVRDLTTRLPAYLVPARVLLLAELPLNANGKVDARALPAPDAVDARAERTEPANELERHLAAIWERVLGVGSIGVHDDFFELGGHSLLGVKLLNEVADVFGQELPLSSLIGSPTVFAQARVLHEGIGSPEASSLVKIQPRGTLPPIFCVCSLGGTVLNQRPLAQRLGDDQPFYGLQASALALAGDEAPSLEEYAAHYVAVMRSVAPHGPYKVGGHSFGGVVAYEIARQLEEQGETVELLFILDSALPNLASGPRDRVAAALAFLRGLPFAPAEVLHRALRDPGRLWRELGQKLRFTRARLRRLLPSPQRTAPGRVDARERGLSTADIVEMTDWPENNKRIAARHYQALVRYRPRPYGGRVTLFRSRLHSPFLGLGRAMGWDKVARGGVAIESLPGGHMSILAPPHVDVLARKLRAVLARRDRAAA